MHSILVVDDEPNYLVVLSELLKDEGFEVFTAADGEQGLKIVKGVDLDMVISDMQMPGMDGMMLLHEIKKIYEDLPVLIITAYAEIDKAVAAMQAGAYSYLAKPFSNDELIVTINKAVGHYSLIRENTRLRQEMRQRSGFSGMVGKNPRMRQVYRTDRKSRADAGLGPDHRRKRYRQGTGGQGNPYQKPAGGVALYHRQLCRTGRQSAGKRTVRP